MRHIDLLIVGGGSAGLAAAISARENGIKDILIVERNQYLGGILKQCIHNGFGIKTFQEDLTGVEYAKKIADRIEELQIKYALATFILDINEDCVASLMSREEGIIKVKAKAIVLAMGCRERPFGNLLIPGDRCAGIMTAGTAQRLLNIEGYIPGENVVILGSGDIGLIMARQLVVENVSVKRVVEIMPYSSGLTRNIVQCLEDFLIPINYRSTVLRTIGKKRLEKVVIAKVDMNRNPIPETEEEIECDTLIVSAGLIPENELSRNIGIKISDITKGPVVDQYLRTSIKGVFSCGNVLHVHDLVDNVYAEGEKAGKNAALYLRGLLPEPNREETFIIEGQGVKGVVPQIIRKSELEEEIEIMFRTDSKYINTKIHAELMGQVVYDKKYKVLAPGEMQTMTINKEAFLNGHGDLIVRIDESEEGLSDG